MKRIEETADSGKDAGEPGFSLSFREAIRSAIAGFGHAKELAACNLQTASSFNRLNGFGRIFTLEARPLQVFFSKAYPQRGQVMRIFPLPRGTRTTSLQLGQRKKA